MLKQTGETAMPSNSAEVIPVKIGGTGSGTAVFFEVTEVTPAGSSDGWQTVAKPGEITADAAGESLDHVVDAVKPIAARVVDQFRSLGDAAPESIELTLGVKLSAKVGFFVAESQGEASIGLKLTWKTG
jgi:hypothetical protein